MAEEQSHITTIFEEDHFSTTATILLETSVLKAFAASGECSRLMFPNGPTLLIGTNLPLFVRRKPWPVSALPVRAKASALLNRILVLSARAAVSSTAWLPVLEISGASSPNAISALVTLLLSSFSLNVVKSSPATSRLDGYDLIVKERVVNSLSCVHHNNHESTRAWFISWSCRHQNKDQELINQIE